MSLTDSIAAVVARRDLTEERARLAMDTIMSGNVSDAQVAAFITALRMKGESKEEITGFAKAIRSKGIIVKASRTNLVDTCGTGGDSSHTFNISTTAALVVTACGLPVAKHGNRSVSSKCGSADVLEALGVNINLSPSAAAGCIDEIGIGFLFAPAFHAAMKHAVRPRKEVGIRTVFNLLGPLVNPAGASVQLMGVYDPALTETLASVLSNLGTVTGLVVHGAGGLDEISTLGATRITELRNGSCKTYEITPEMFGMPVATIDDMRGGDSKENAAIIMRILGGEDGPRQDIVALNAAAALYAAGKARDLAGGLEMSRRAILSGRALEKLVALQEYSNKVMRKEEAAGEHCSPPENHAS